MFQRVATFSVLLIALTILLSGPVAAEEHEESFELNKKDYSYSSLRVGVRNLFETFARNMGRRLFSAYTSDDTANIMKYSSSQSLLQPELDKEGFWVGAPSVSETDNTTYIFYRLRDPFRRGWKVVVAEKDGEKFNTVWELTKYEYGEIRSLEGGALAKRNNSYSLFLSYQEEGTGKWSIKHLKAEKPADFNFSQSEKLDLKFEDYPHFKDPIIYEDKLIVHAASRNFFRLTNIVVELPFNGTMSQISIGSEDYSGNRITSITQFNNTKLVFFDHKKNIVFSGEEKAKLGVLSSPGHVKPLDNLSLLSNHSTQSLRYVKAFNKDGLLKLYYESALPGKGHELREAELELNRFLESAGISSKID